MMEFLAAVIGVGLSPFKAAGGILAALFVRNTWLGLGIAIAVSCAEYALTLAIFGLSAYMDIMIASVLAGAAWWGIGRVSALAFPTLQRRNVKGA